MLLRIGLIRTLAGLVLGAVLALVVGCAVNPVTGKQEIAFVPESQELALGQKNYAPYRQAQGGDYVVDPALARYVQEVGARLAKVADRPLPYEFRVINDSTPNAWALPGGKIAINRGLLTELQSEAELAAVLAHEIVHAAARHSAQSIERGVFLQGALIAAGVALADSDYRDVGLLGAGIGSQLIDKKYGRDDESEADHYGIRYMVRAGYDPAAAVQLQETFVRLAEGKEADWLQGLFATHPPSRERVEANRRLVAELGNPGGELGEARYREATARIRRAEPAYVAYAEAQKLAAKGERDKALARLDEAIRIEPDEAAFHALRGQILVAEGREREGLSALDRAVALNPTHFRPLLLRGLARHKAGQAESAAADLQRSIGLLPTAEAYYGLGRLAEAGGRSEQAVSYFRQAAVSKSATGKLAGERLARLDLAGNPGRYLATSIGLGADGYLVVKLSNRAAVPVSDIRIAVGRARSGGIEQAAAYRLNRSLAAGESVQIKTAIGPLTAAAARGYAARVTAARPAE
jgi:predicted Zn-dependent protease